MNFNDSSISFVSDFLHHLDVSIFLCENSQDLTGIVKEFVGKSQLQEYILYLFDKYNIWDKVSLDTVYYLYKKTYLYLSEIFNFARIWDILLCDASTKLLIWDHNGADKSREKFIQHLGKTSEMLYRVKKLQFEYSKNMVENITLTSTNSIVFTITTCKRFDLFCQTMNSFLTNCLDISKIHGWICVDDNSCEEDREKMKKLYPFFQFVWKTPKQKGHAKSMNILYSMTKEYKYIFHCEDDFLFWTPLHYMTILKNVLDNNPRIGQVQINRNYAEIGTDYCIKGGFVDSTNNFILHDYQPHGLDSNWINRWGQSLNCAYWPHFSFRPGLMRRKILDDVGEYSLTANHVEMDYAQRVWEKGYHTAFLNGIFIRHIGRLTSERNLDDMENAYTLNDEAQFGQKKENHNIDSDNIDSDIYHQTKIRWNLDPQGKHKIIKIRGLCNWTDTDHLHIELEKLLTPQFQLVTKGEDYTLVINSTTEQIEPSKTIWISMEPYQFNNPPQWGYWHNIWKEDNTNDLFFAACADDGKDDTIPTCHAFRQWHLSPSLSSFSSLQIVKSQNNVLAIVTSSKYIDPGHEFRIDFIHYLEKYTTISLHIYGYSNEHGFKNYKGSLPYGNKDEGILPYKYILHAENHSIPNYVTEKLWDGILGESLTFYWGCPLKSLKCIVDPLALYYLDPTKSFSQLAEEIQRAMNNDMYSQRLPIILHEKKRFLEREGMFSFLHRIIHPNEWCPRIYVINLDRRPERWFTFRKTYPHLPLQRFSAVDGKEIVLTMELRYQFRDNDYNFRRGIIGCALSHIELWKRLARDSESDHYVILEDDANIHCSEANFSEFCRSCVEENRIHLKNRHGWNTLFLGWHMWPDYISVRKIHEDGQNIRLVNMGKDYLGGTFAYIISREGAQKYLDIIEKRGIQNGIDTFMQKQFECNNNINPVLSKGCEGMLITSEYTNDPKNISGYIDSDIQYDFESCRS